MAELHVSISAEPIYQLGPLTITNSQLTGTIVSILLIAFVLYFSSQQLQSRKIGRLQALVESIIEAIFNLCRDIAGEKKAREFFPLIATAMIFILFNNWFGLLPGVGTIGITEEPVEAGTHAALPQAHAAEESITGDEQTDVADPLLVESEEEAHGPTFIPLLRAATADLNTTIALALISMTMVQVYGFRHLGAHYFTKFFNFKQGPIFTFVGILELVSDISKVLSFAFRLFGNVFAGEVLLAVIAFLAPALLPLPFIGLEIFVGFIQALVFAMLSLVFINMATIGHDDH